MAKPTRTEKQRELDRCEVARLIRRGQTVAQIADSMPHISKSQIKYDLKLIVDEHLAERSRDVDGYLYSKLEEYAEVKREAWWGWEQSKEPGIDREGNEKKPEPDVRFLSQVQQIIDKECDLLGIAVPKRKELVDPSMLTTPEKYLEEVLPHVKRALEILHERKKVTEELPPILVAPGAQQIPTVLDAPMAEEFDLESYLANREKNGGQ